MTKKQHLAAARRARAGAIGLLECCRCSYPLEQHSTATFHALECPAHAMTLSAMEAAERSDDDKYLITSWRKL